MKKFYSTLCLFLAMVLTMQYSYGQGVTTSSMTGTVTDSKGEGLPGATVVAIHTPSGTQYGTSTLADGRYTIPNMRVGGPYTVTVSYISFQQQVVNNVNLSLGTAATLNFKMLEQSSQLNEVQIIADRNNTFSSDRTGAGTNVTREVVNALPTLSRSINDFTRLTPQASGQNFGGQDNRLNNITVDGSILNSSFGLTGQPGGRTGSTPISLDAIEQVQINIAPYDVRQSGFTGAGINAVTRSGTNEFSGSVFYNIQNEKLVGDKAKGNTVTTNDFENKQAGFRVGGPIIKNKLFFFLNGEMERRTDPATQYRANKGGEPVEGNVTRVLESDLNQLSAYLRNNFGYETGPYQDYNFHRDSDKILAKLDYNISQNHRASIRFNMLDSEQDVLISNSGTTGGNRRSTSNALNFANSNYIQTEKIYSTIGELNSTFGSRFSNNLIVGYTYQNEDRRSRGDFFPLIEILQGGNTYISAGFEPYTYNNKLNYSTYQLQNNFTYYAGKHTLTAGFNAERLTFNNVYTQFGAGIYTYNSLADFYAAADAYLADPNATTSPVTLRRFQQQYSALPGNAEPVAQTRVTYTGLYLQDNYSVLPNLNITGGVRVDVPFFDNTGYKNAAVDNMNFRDAEGNDLKVSTDKLPAAKPLFAPRLGFNWDVFDDKTLQVRGGSGIFTGRPAFVWISNQMSNNGVLLGAIDEPNTRNIGFNPNPFAHLPENPTLPANYQLNVTDNNFRFPQVWRSNLAVDKSLIAGIVGTLEVIYSKNVNAVQYVNINQLESTGSFNGPDDRPRFPGGNANRINSNVTGNYYLTNTSQGHSYTITAQLEKPFSNGLFARFAYNFGEAKDLMSAGSTAASSYNAARTVNGNNYPELSFSDNDQRHRVIGSVSYRKEYAGFGATQISLFGEARNQNRFSYTYAQDMNGDGINGNDLLYIPRDASELRFLPITTGSGANQVTLFTREQQIEAFNAYIEQDEYLRSRRGQYAERNGVVMPWISQVDLSFVQEFFMNVGGKRNTLQLRADIFNFGNMLNSEWGVGRRFINGSPLVSAGTTADGIPQYRMATLGSGANQVLLKDTYQSSANISDVWRAQLGIRYIFN